MLFFFSCAIFPTLILDKSKDTFIISGVMELQEEKKIYVPLPPGSYGNLQKQGFPWKGMLIYSPAVKSTVLICFSFLSLHKAHTEV